MFVFVRMPTGTGKSGVIAVASPCQPAGRGRRDPQGLRARMRTLHPQPARERAERLRLNQVHTRTRTVSVAIALPSETLFGAHVLRSRAAPTGRTGR